MASSIAAVADAVVTALNGGTFSIPFTSARKWVPAVRLEELSSTSPTVTVVPTAYELTPNTRVAAQKDLEVDIGVQQRLPPSTDPESAETVVAVDNLIGLLEEIGDFFTRGAMGATGYRWARSEIFQPFYDPQHLRQRVFTGVARITFTKL